jgi:Mu-like prophage major head subunit gpT
MSLSNQSIVEGATVRWRTDFERGMLESEGQDAIPWRDNVQVVDEVQTIFDPVASEHRIIWAESDPEFRKNTGQVQFESFVARSVAVKAEMFNKGLRAEIETLRTEPILQMYGSVVAGWGSGLVLTQRRDFYRHLLRGDTAEYGLAYDGQTFFDTDHPGKNSAGAIVSQANLFDLALNETNLRAVVTAAVQYRNEQGLSFGNKWRTSQMTTPMTSRDSRPAVTPSFHLYVGAANAGVAANLSNLATDNPSSFAGTFTWEQIDMIEGAFANYWFLKFYNPVIRRPMLFLGHGAAFDAKVGPDTEPGRLRGEAEWTAWAAWGLAYNEWASIVMCRA